MLIDSGLCGDIYKINETQIEKVFYSNDGKSCEITNLELLQGIYGIPRYYHTNKYMVKRFYGKNGDGVYSEIRDDLIKRGPACGIVMEYAGNLTLDNFKQLTLNQLLKIMFNVCYICFELFRKHTISHGDLHRGNIVLKKVKPYSKTYYVHDTKYKISNQLYKVSLVDFESCKQSSFQNQMNDFNYLCSFFDSQFTQTSDFISCFETNFDIFKLS